LEKTVPRLKNPNCQRLLNQLFKDVRDLKMKNSEKPKFRFIFVVDNENNRNQRLFAFIKKCFDAQKEKDPMLGYIKDSPVHRHLRIGNIYPPKERPGFSEPFIVCRKRLMYQDRLEEKIFNGYVSQICHARDPL
jgi:hypothetical protein